jgi:hypothetical protein
MVFSVCIMAVMCVVCCTGVRLHGFLRTLFCLILLFAVVFGCFCASFVSSDVYVHVVLYRWVWLNCVSLAEGNGEYRVSSTRKESNIKVTIYLLNKPNCSEMSSNLSRCRVVHCKKLVLAGAAPYALYCATVYFSKLINSRNPSLTSP